MKTILIAVISIIALSSCASLDRYGVTTDTNGNVYVTGNLGGLACNLSNTQISDKKFGTCRYSDVKIK